MCPNEGGEEESKTSAYLSEEEKGSLSFYNIDMCSATACIDAAQEIRVESGCSQDPGISAV